MSEFVKVYLLPFDQQPSVFYSEDDGEAELSAAARTGLVGWFERTGRRLRTSPRHPKSRFARWTAATWEWLQSRMYPNERLLAAFRSACSIVVSHGASRTSEEVRVLWDAYLARRFRRQLLWLAFDGLLSPVAVLLSPLPGPNVIGYWFAYRAVRHLLILLGIRRVRSGRVVTTFVPVPGLEASKGRSDRAWLPRAASQFHLKELHDFVERIAPAGPTIMARVTGARDETQQPCDS